MDAALAERVPENVFMDALLLLLEVLDLEVRLDDAALAEAVAYGRGGDPVDRLLPAWGAGEPVPRSVVLSAMGLFATRWFEGGAMQVYRLPDRPGFADDADPQPDLAMLACLSGLCELWFSDDVDRAECRDDAARAFLTFGAALRRRKRMHEAARAYAVAHNLAASPARRAVAAQQGARAAAAGDAPSLAALHLIGLARGLAEVSLASPADRNARAAALTALEGAARHLRDVDDNREEAEARLSVVAEALHDKVARTLVWLASDATDEVDDDHSRVRRAMSLYTQPVWELDKQQLNAALPLVMSFVPDVELLTGVPVDDKEVQLESSWTTGTFDHPRYRQAIPHGRALFREGRLESILFEVVHETTHVACMLSGLGAATMAMRAAALELEGTLWAHVPHLRDVAGHETGDTDDPDSDTDHLVDPTDDDVEGEPGDGGTATEDDLQHRRRLRSSLVAPLAEHTALALAQAEQALEPVRGMRVLQRVWTPWLEGVAAFLELTSDPSEGDVSSLIGDVLANLVDVYVGDLSGGVDALERELAQNRAQIEQLYADLLATSARPRLRHYLGTRWGKYGPGYLAVRSVVASWRQTLGRPISGTDAARVVLHLTRFGTHDAVPDLGLGVHRFLPAAQSAMVSWVRRAGRMSRADLEYVLAPDGDWGWLDGRVLRLGDVEPDNVENTYERFHAQVLRAWSVHRGDEVDLDRVPDADDACRRVMRLTADALANGRQRTEISDSVAGQLDVQSRLLPIGSLRTPFWFNRPTNTLVVPLRTTEMDKDHGGPGFDMVGLPLTPESAEDLLTQIRRHPGERLEVTRLADLSHTAFRSLPVPGLNVIAYRLGDWLHVRPAGLLATLGATPPDVVADVKERLVPNRQRRIEAELCEGVVPAGRTASWIEDAHGWNESGLDLPIGPWVQRVHRLAELVRDRSDEEELESAAGVALLAGLWGDAARTIAPGGITVLTLGEAPRLARLVEVLLSSSAAPLPSPWLEGLAPDDPINAIMVKNGGWDVRPVIEELS